MQFKPGDKIAFKDQQGTGIIISVSGKNKVLVRTEEGMEIEYPLSSVVPVTSAEKYILSAAEEQRLLKGKLKAEKKSNKESKAHGKEKTMEVDLHIHELVEDMRGLSNSDMLRIQMLHFRKKMAEAIEKNCNKIIFIHGVGEGVLKAEIHHALLDYSAVEVKDALYTKYGRGATEVSLKGG